MSLDLKFGLAAGIFAARNLENRKMTESTENQPEINRNSTEKPFRHFAILEVSGGKNAHGETEFEVQGHFWTGLAKVTRR